MVFSMEKRVRHSVVVIGGMPNVHIRWGDLVSPRAVYAFTIGDAWAALPTLFAIAGCFMGGCIVVWLVKKLLECIFLRRQQPKKLMLKHCEVCKESGKKTKTWTVVPIHSYCSIAHLLIESMFFLALVIVALFAASIGDINIWQSAIGSIGIGLIGTYIFGAGLSQAGAGYFVFMMNAIAYGEYWCLIGSGGEVEGRVCRVTLLFIELERQDIESTGGVLIRVWMSTVISGNWKRDFHKEEYAEVVSIWDVNEVNNLRPTAPPLDALDLPHEETAIRVGGRNKYHVV